jgi:hypothetical protein
VNNIEELKQIALDYIELYETVEMNTLNNCEYYSTLEQEKLNLRAECQEMREKVNSFSSEEKSDIKPDNNVGSWYDNTHNYTLEEVVKILKERSKAEWILSPFQDEEDNANDNYQYECSNCGYGDIHAKSAHVPYCWHCGAEMEDNNG